MRKTTQFIFQMYRVKPKNQLTNEVTSPNRNSIGDSFINLDHSLIEHSKINAKTINTKLKICFFIL